MRIRCRDTLFLSLREIYRLRDSVPRPFIGQLELEIRRRSGQLEIPRVQYRNLLPRIFDFDEILAWILLLRN